MYNSKSMMMNMYMAKGMVMCPMFICVQSSGV